MVGTGGMGGAMARAVLAAGRPLVICDTNPAALDPLLAAGATRAETPQDVAACCNVIAVVVVNDEQVRQVVQPGTDAIWAIHSTVSPETIFEIADRAKVLDAPVTGGEIGAERGELAMMVGGDLALFEQVKPFFEPYASMMVHLGPLGSGQRCKLLRNLVTYAELTIADEVRRLVDACGLDADAFRAVVAHSDTNIPAHGGLLRADPWLAGTSAEIPHKDIRAALAVARTVDIDTPMAALVDVRIEVALEAMPSR